ncbi:MAG: NAD(P)/FAD-dependent oxidoreductase, partial [Chloroflexota bacterium]
MYNPFMFPKTNYDTIVIGSGAGGLAAAVSLAQSGQAVLVIEQHEVAGGWCQSFTLEGYRFSPGVHYIGGLDRHGSLRATYKGLGVSNDLAFCELNPEGYDHIIVGEERFDIPKGKNRYIAKLISRFPHEEIGIQGFFDETQNLIGGMGRLKIPKNILQLKRQIKNIIPLFRWGFRTGQDLINRFVTDPLLRAILAGQSGDHGLPPSQVSALIHAGIIHHYFDGGYFPKGGAFTIPRAFVRALKKAGGEILLETQVEKILLEGKRAVGVTINGGHEIRATSIISNADPGVTYSRLIGVEKLSWRLRRKLKKTHYSVSALSLFFAVDMDL